MTTMNTIELSADRPVVDPKDDLFERSNFAKHIAKMISRYDSKDCIAIALHGAWGSGKTTVINFTLKYLENEKTKFIVVKFNPWWFSGKEDLVRAFLDQLSSTLSKNGELLKKIGEKIDELSGYVGNILDTSGVTGGICDYVVKIIRSLTKQKPKDIHALKTEIQELLSGFDKKILIVIDDIDRLTPQETWQMFACIKGLVDFPNVIYLLAYDRNVAAKGITQQVGADGEAFLEKIVQISFNVPAIDHSLLHRALFTRLNHILHDIPSEVFDNSRWTNMFLDGIRHFFNIPRDVIRFANTLSVTYPAVRCEVNAVDFIAIEAIRVFLPDIYDYILRNYSRMYGNNVNDYSSRGDADDTVRKELQELIPQHIPNSFIRFLEDLFPKISATGYGTSWLTTWRKNLNICHPDMFSIYFGLSISSETVTQAEYKSLIQATRSVEDFTNYLLNAKSTKNSNGISKIYNMIVYLADYAKDDIQHENVGIVIESFLRIGDNLNIPADAQGPLAVSAPYYIARIICDLLKSYNDSHINKLICDCFKKFNSFFTQLLLIRYIQDKIDEQKIYKNQNEIDENLIFELKKIWIERIDECAITNEIINLNEFEDIIYYWNEFSKSNNTKLWCREHIKSDTNLINFICKFLRYNFVSTTGCSSSKRILRLNPKKLCNYINIDDCAKRLIKLKHDNSIPGYANEAIDAFLREYELIQKGIDPDDMLSRMFNA